MGGGNTRDGVVRRRLVPAGSLLLALALLSLIAAGCGGSKGASSSTTRATHTTRTTAAPSAQVMAAGQKVFAKRCALCHTIAGKIAHPTFIESPIPNLDEVKLKLAYVMARVRSGGFDMEAFDGQLKPAQISAVAAYVTSVAGRNIGASEGSGDVTLGESVFTSNCQRCHSIAGKAATGRPEFPGTDFTAVRPSESMVIARITKGIREEMPSFKKKLTKAQMHAVAAYVSSAAGR